MTRIIESINDTTVKGWPTFVYAMVIAGIAWLVGYYVRWNSRTRRPYIRNRAETNWEKAANSGGEN